MPDLESLLLGLEQPPELVDAPAWAKLIYAQGRLLALSIGEEPDADGNGGTGLTGKVANLEKRLKPFESLKDKAWGAAAMAGILLIALWWIVQDKVAGVLGLHR